MPCNPEAYFKHDSLYLFDFVILDRFGLFLKDMFEGTCRVFWWCSDRIWRVFWNFLSGQDLDQYAEENVLKTFARIFLPPPSGWGC